MGSTNPPNKTSIAESGVTLNIPQRYPYRHKKEKIVTALRAAPPSSKYQVRSWETAFLLPRPIDAAR
jgi:hypothetical protein